MIRRYVAIAFALFLVTCSLDYSDVYLTEAMAEEIPDSILENFSYTTVREGEPAYRLEADRAEFFDEKKTTYLEGVLFREFDGSGELLTEGSGDRAVYFTETENAELDGELRFYSAKEEATVTTDYLYWNNEEKILTGRPEGRVRIVEDSGSQIDGLGFEADVRTKSVDFSGRVTGTYITDETE